MKIRIEFTEHGKIRFVSHRDVGNAFVRALRKLQLPVAYSEGFSPRPKLSFGLALSVGHESEAEYLDVNLTETLDLEHLPEQLSQALPAGITVTRVGYLSPGSPSLQEAVTSCNWTIEVTGVSKVEATGVVQKLMGAQTLPFERSRKGKRNTVDVRPAILDLEVLEPTENGMLLSAELGTDTVTLRPNELVEFFGSGAALGRVVRIAQWTNTEGSRCKPLDAPVGHTLVCAP